MGWIRCKAADLTIGDGIALTRGVKCKIGGRFVQGEVAKRAKDGTWGKVKGPKREPYRYKARVVDIQRSASGRTVFVVDHIEEIGTIPDGGQLPPWRDYLSADMLDWKTTALERHTEHGVTDRNFPGGQTYLLDLLRDAAGGDNTSQNAIERVARCVHPADTEAFAKRKTGDDAALIDIGLDAAREMLSGRSIHVEMVLRQLLEKSPIPSAQGREDFEAEVDAIMDEIGR
jgi:hypothetical protein